MKVRLNICLEVIFKAGSTMESKLKREFNSLREMDDYLKEYDTPVDLFDETNSDEVEHLTFSYNVDTIVKS